MHFSWPQVDQAFQMLKTMDSSSPHYAKARMKMADIYMKHRKDKRGFARCYKDIVDATPTSENYLILGDALLAIHEPMDAIVAYHAALRGQLAFRVKRACGGMNSDRRMAIPIFFFANLI